MKQRRILCLLLVLALFVTQLPQLGLTAYATVYLVDIDRVEYEVLEDHAWIRSAHRASGEITIPATVLDKPVTYAGEEAFRDNRHITAVTFPEGLVEIREACFSNCRNLERVTLPQTLQRIGKKAFLSCESLMSLTVPESVTECTDAFEDSGISIIYGHSDAVEEAARMAGVCYIDTVTGEEIGALDQTIDGVLYFVEPDHAEIACGKNAQGALTVPQTVGGVPVTKARASAFYNNIKLTSIQLPEGLTEIGDSAFYRCTALKSLYLPESVRRIGEDAFCGCWDIESFHIPLALEEIGARAFADCGGIRLIYLSPSFEPDGLYGLYGEGSVADISGYYSLGAPYYVYWPGTRAAQYVRDLTEKYPDTKSFALPTKGLLYLSDRAVYRRDGDHVTLLLAPTDVHREISTVVDPYIAGLPVTHIAKDAFQRMGYREENYQLVILPPTVTTIESGALERINISYTYIPESVTSIADDAFPKDASKCLILGQKKTTAYRFANKHNIAFQEASVRFLPFEDVSESAWYYSSVFYAYYNGLMSGESSKKFSPGKNMSRAMLVQVLYNISGYETESYGFTDVPTDAWYAKAVDWAAQNGIVAGTSETTFSPNAPVTREQAATILCRYAKKLGFSLEIRDDALSGFRDGKQVSDFALEGMRWAVSNGLIQGTSSRRLSPQGKATRAEVAAILMRFIRLLLSQEDTESRGMQGILLPIENNRTPLVFGCFFDCYSPL